MGLGGTNDLTGKHRSNKRKVAMRDVVEGLMIILRTAASGV